MPAALLIALDRLGRNSVLNEPIRQDPKPDRHSNRRRPCWYVTQPSDTDWVLADRGASSDEVAHAEHPAVEQERTLHERRTSTTMMICSSSAA